MTDTMNDFAYSDGDVDTNRSTAQTLNSIVDARYSRRQTLFGGVGAVTTAVFGGALLAGCGENDENNIAPIAAGTSGSSSSGRVVTLTGSASDSDGSIASTMWTQVSGPTVTLANASNTTATFLAPSVAASTPLVFRLSATDDRGAVTAADATITVTPGTIGFTAVPKSLADIVAVPAGYTVSVLYRLGDPIAPGVPAYANDGTDTNFAQRGGDHNDALYYFGLAATGATPDANNSLRGLLVMNHENITQRYLHPNGATSVGGIRPEAEVIKEMEAHGTSTIEVSRANAAGAWSYNQGSTLNRRVTPLTPTAFSGPVRGSALLQTLFSPTGVVGRGTINNCANGFTAWGTSLTCEENWAGYFRRRAATDNALRTPKEVTALARYGVTSSTGNYGWTTVVPADPANTIYRRWTSEVSAASAAEDFRNEANQFGWVVETDPYDAASTPRKRTALGRFGHEGAWPSNFVAGVRPAIYMGDDGRREYIYKFVSSTPWAAADASNANRLAIGDKYLDSGTLYVARFNADGTGIWMPLTFGVGPITAANAAYPFADQADVLTNARLAADALGATPMDRPEWTATNNVTGEIYVTLTNNNAALRPLAGTDAANPRHYNDPRGATNNFGNPNGHIIRFRENGNTTEALGFRWDIFAFGAGADLNPANINLSNLDDSNDFSSPDGLWFGRPQNASGLVNPLLWIQTDDGAYTDVTNCMMLVAQPGITGDGAPRTISNMDATGAVRTQATLVGKAPGATLRRFLVGPKECEITGVDSTPDGRTLFVNIQHPGEDTTAGFPTSFPSNWPASQTNPSAVSRPRSSTIVITKDDGGIVGL